MILILLILVVGMIVLVAVFVVMKFSVSLEEDEVSWLGQGAITVTVEFW